MQHVEGWQVSRLLSNTLIYSSVWPDEVTHHILCSTTAAVECLWFHICLAKNDKTKKTLLVCSSMKYQKVCQVCF